MFSENTANTTYPRSLRSVIAADLATYPVVAVMGARQVGKSTLCRDIAAQLGMAYQTLDNRDVLAQAREDPDGLLASLGGDGAYIDEAQRAPELFLAIKAIVDRGRRPGSYLLSGSNQPKMTGGVADSLLGRAAYRTLRPLTVSELRLDDVHPGWSFLFNSDDASVTGELRRRSEAGGPLAWRAVVTTGGFPDVIKAPLDDQQRRLDDYVTVFARRDIRQLIGIDSSDRFESFLRLVAARTGQELHFSGFATDLGIGISTAHRWIAALQQSYMIELLPPYSRNAGHRVIKSPKLFMVDSALALAAARESTPTGFHLENLVAGDVAVWKDGAAGRGLHHWRRASGQEVDFVLEEAGALLPVEIKSSDSVGSSDAKHLRTFRAEYRNVPRGILLSSDPEIRSLGEGVIAAPWWAVV
ncbi:MAG: ATP-binding protein [Gemmatimonadales bacterium]